MSVRIDAVDFALQIAQFERTLNRELAAEVSTQVANAQRVAEQGADRGIYKTQPGRVYVRTGLYRRAIRVERLLAPNGYGLSISDDAPYASAIEYGDGSVDFSAADIDELGRTVGVPGMDASTGRVPYYGRSGLNYRQPQPVLTAAGLVALYRLRSRFERVITTF